MRHRQIISVRDGEKGRAAADRGQTTGGAAVEYQLRWTSAPDDFDIAPHDALRVAGPESLHPRLFRRKPTGEMNRGDASLHAIRDLSVCEDAAQKTVAVAVDHVRYAVDFGRVQAQADDGRHH